MQQMQQMHKTWGAAFGRPPKRGGGGLRPPPTPFWAQVLCMCCICCICCVAFTCCLHVCMFCICFTFFIYILFASLLGTMRQLLRQWLLPRMLWMLSEKSIKCTFWPGFLPLQGTPTGENNGWGRPGAARGPPGAARGPPGAARVGRPGVAGGRRGPPGGRRGAARMVGNRMLPKSEGRIFKI